MSSCLDRRSSRRPTRTPVPMRCWSSRTQIPSSSPGSIPRLPRKHSSRWHSRRQTPAPSRRLAKLAPGDWCRQTRPGRSPSWPWPAGWSEIRLRSGPVLGESASRSDQGDQRPLPRAVPRDFLEQNSLGRYWPARGRAEERLPGPVGLREDQSLSQRYPDETPPLACRQVHPLHQPRPILPGPILGWGTASARGPDRIRPRHLNGPGLPRLPQPLRPDRPRSRRLSLAPGRVVWPRHCPLGNRECPSDLRRPSYHGVRFRPRMIAAAALAPGQSCSRGPFQNPANVPVPSILEPRVETARRSRQAIRLPGPSLPRPACCRSGRQAHSECRPDPPWLRAPPMARPGRRHPRCSHLQARASRALPVEWFRPRWRCYRNRARPP